MKRVAAVVLFAMLLIPGVALAGSSTDAALGLGAFAVFNQILSGTGVFGAFHQAPVVAQPVVVERQVVVEQPVVVERRVVVEQPVYYPQPVYYSPAPVYVAPAPPVYVAPAPVVIAPQPVVIYRSSPPVYYRHYVRYERGWRGYRHD